MIGKRAFDAMEAENGEWACQRYAAIMVRCWPALDLVNQRKGLTTWPH